MRGAAKNVLSSYKFPSLREDSFSLTKRLIPNFICPVFLATIRFMTNEIENIEDKANNRDRAFG
jgi:hypothetical protein